MRCSEQFGSPRPSPAYKGTSSHWSQEASHGISRKAKVRRSISTAACSRHAVEESYGPGDPPAVWSWGCRRCNQHHGFEPDGRAYFALPGERRPARGITAQLTTRRLYVVRRRYMMAMVSRPASGVLLQHEPAISASRPGAHSRGGGVGERHHRGDVARSACAFGLHDIQQQPVPTTASSSRCGRYHPEHP